MSIDYMKPSEYMEKKRKWVNTLKYVPFSLTCSAILGLTSAVIDVGGINLELAILISTTLSDYGPCRCCSIQDGPPARLQVVGIFGAVIDVARVHLPLPILRLLHLGLEIFGGHGKPDPRSDLQWGVLQP